MYVYIYIYIYMLLILSTQEKKFDPPERAAPAKPAAPEFKPHTAYPDIEEIIYYSVSYQSYTSKGVRRQ